MWTRNYATKMQDKMHHQICGVCVNILRYAYLQKSKNVRLAMSITTVRQQQSTFLRSLSLYRYLSCLCLVLLGNRQAFWRRSITPTVSSGLCCIIARLFERTLKKNYSFSWFIIIFIHHEWYAIQTNNKKHESSGSNSIYSQRHT